MADVTSEGLGVSGGESSSQELFSGSLESPKGNEGTAQESPKVEAQSVDPGTSTGQSGDSELDEGIFTDLEKDIPEALKPHATNVKKKLQAFLTKKTQAISEELKTLKANQITDEIKSSYATLYNWYDRIQQNPKDGLKALASQYGVSIEALVNAAEAEGPQEVELTEADLKTAADYAAFARQEARKAVAEIRDKEVKPLKESVAKYEGSLVQEENARHGSTVLENAVANLPGFAVEVEGKKTLSEDGKKALALVLSPENQQTKEFYGPHALENAFFKITGHSSMNKVRELESQLSDLKKNLAGVSPPPGGKNQKTTLTPSKPGRFWDDLKSEPLI